MRQPASFVRRLTCYLRLKAWHKWKTEGPSSVVSYVSGKRSLPALLFSGCGERSAWEIAACPRRVTMERQDMTGIMWSGMQCPRRGERLGERGPPEGSGHGRGVHCLRQRERQDLWGVPQLPAREARGSSPDSPAPIPPPQPGLMLWGEAGTTAGRLF